MTNWFQTHSISPIYGWGLSKRWIVQGGPSVENDGLMIDGLISSAQKEGCVYIEIRCYDDYSPYRQQLEEAGFTYLPHYDVTIDPSQALPDAKMRQIRKAQEDGYRWRETSNEKDVRVWYKQLRRLYWYKIHRPLPRLKWFKEMIYKKGCKLLLVERSIRALPVQLAQRSIVGGVLLAIEDNKTKAYEWYICGQVMSTWAAIEYCRQQGIKCFDTMGAGVPDIPYGVRDFKLQMGGTLHEWGRYICVLRPTWYKLGKWIINLFA